MNPTRILFVSHSYPPIVGGVETQNHALCAWLGRHAQVSLLANRRRSRLPWFLLYAPFYVLFNAARYDVVLLGSGILGHCAFLAKLFTRTPVVVVTHGLDLTWNNGFYQAFWVRRFLPRADRLIAVGNETIRAGEARGIPAQCFTFIPNGIDSGSEGMPQPRERLEALLGETLEGKKVVLSFGRLAKRKGAAWFIENVLPRLPQNVIYVVAGGGPEKANILASADRAKVETRLRFLGVVDDEARNILLQTADLFVQPNIRVAGDMEGFGIAVIEASLNGRMVLAARLEGLQDAIEDGGNGFLIESGDAAAWAARITASLDDDAMRNEFGLRARQYTVEHFHWEKIAQRYLAVLQSVRK
ncbi:MAG TPA: glycosyltransferase family 4 protein [Burkholderiaceae bacterium]